MYATTTETLLQRYWDLQQRMEALSQDEYEGPQGEGLMEEQTLIATLLDERLHPNWNLRKPSELSA